MQENGSLISFPTIFNLILRPNPTHPRPFPKSWFPHTPNWKQSDEEWTPQNLPLGGFRQIRTNTVKNTDDHQRLENISQLQGRDGSSSRPIHDGKEPV